jgi:flavin-dependent dehydrogenase
MIASVEAEFPAIVRDQRVQLWFGLRGLPGYAWYLPKEGGYLNVGIGGFAEPLKRRQQTIWEHWRMFLEMLSATSLFTGVPSDVRGHAYAIRSSEGPVHMDGGYIVGDAAGLATRDMGEGIGPAVESGKLAARSIIAGSDYSVRAIRARSIWDIVFPLS